jgi:hypothetical protein
MTAMTLVPEELVELERRAWTALTSDEDVAEFYEEVLSPDMVMVLPGMVLERTEAMESWMGNVPWRDFEIDDVRVVSLANNAALLTYRAPREGPRQLSRTVHECVPHGGWAVVVGVPAADTVEQQHGMRRVVTRCSYGMCLLVPSGK